MIGDLNDRKLLQLMDSVIGSKKNPLVYFIGMFNEGNGING